MSVHPCQLRFGQQATHFPLETSRMRDESSLARMMALPPYCTVHSSAIRSEMTVPWDCRCGVAIAGVLKCPTWGQGALSNDDRHHSHNCWTSHIVALHVTPRPQLRAESRLRAERSTELGELHGCLCSHSHITRRQRSELGRVLGLTIKNHKPAVLRLVARALPIITRQSPPLAGTRCVRR